MHTTSWNMFKRRKKFMCGEKTNNTTCAEMHLKYCNAKNKKECNKFGIRYLNLHVYFCQKYCKSCKKVVYLEQVFYS